VYEAWYKSPHPAPQLLPAPYGLPELGCRDEIATARYVANPGCYATAVLLGLAPLAKSGLLMKGAPIIADAKSGVTGAGRTPKQNLMFGEVHGNFAPYSIGRAHRHLPEIEQVLATYGIAPGSLIFSPHLLPTDRGILVTLYVSLANSSAARQIFDSAYGVEALVDVLPEGELASLAHVVRTPRAALSLTHASDDVMIVVIALDNLLKGAASQAVQNFNLMWGFSETCGLLPSEENR
jgi:N-acetyl-gamma-glutamyl-phosphate reductase